MLNVEYFFDYSHNGNDIKSFKQILLNPHTQQRWSLELRANNIDMDGAEKIV